MRKGHARPGRTFWFVVLSVLFWTGMAGGHALAPLPGMAAEALQRLPDLSTWEKCGESLRPIPHRRFHQRDRLTHFLASAWYEDNLSLVPSVVALVRLTVAPGTRSPAATPSKVDVDLFTYKMTGAAPALVATEHLKETDQVLVPIWMEDSSSNWALLDLFVGHGASYDTARAAVPAYRFKSIVANNRLDVFFTLLGNSKGPGAPASEVLVQDTETQVRTTVTCLPSGP